MPWKADFTSPGLSLLPVGICAFCWEIAFRVVSLAIIILLLSQPSIVLPGGNRERLQKRGGTYAIAILHAGVISVRGAMHALALYSAPAVVQLQQPIIGAVDDPWYEVTAAVEWTNLLFFSWLAYDLAHILYEYPTLGGGDKVAHHVVMLAASFICGKHRILPIVLAWLMVGEVASTAFNCRFFFLATGRKNSDGFRRANYLHAVLHILGRIVLYAAGLLHLWTARVQVLALADTDAISRPRLLGLLSVLGCGFAFNVASLESIVSKARGATSTTSRKDKHA